jgi:hypothetical protein
MAINGFGASARSGHVIFATTKFRGAWLVLILTPFLVLVFFHPPPA